MSLPSLVEGIGLIGASLGIIGFMQDNIREPNVKGAHIRIKAGLLPGEEDPGMGGKIAAAFAWDVDDNYLGRADGKKIKKGDTADLTIDSSAPGRRAEYIGVAAAKDAVCISWVTVRMNDDTPGGAWTGDIGYQCGQNWYENHELAGYIDEDPNKPYIPKCTWLDEDHTKGVPSAAMKFSVRGYGTDVVKTIEKQKACDLTLWGPDNGPINGKPEKRSARPRLPWMQDKLVVSSMSQHKAANMCSSETSWGPDFVGSDGMFCDMETKTLTPLCSTSNVNGCLEIDTEEKKVKKRSFIAKREVETVHKEYKHIDAWN